jgi:hypothetical protein
MRRGLLVGAFVIVALCVVAVEAGDLLYVQVRDTELRATPGFLSTIEERLSFGSEVSFLASRSGWVQVTVVETGKTGWVHATSVEEDRTTQIQLEGESTTRTVSSREVALAGRGFNETLEHEYGESRSLDFAPVDALEARSFDPVDIVGFVRDARLREDFLQEVE